MEKVTAVIVWGACTLAGITLIILPFFTCQNEALIGRLLASSIFTLWAIMALFFLSSIIRKGRPRAR